MYKENIYYRLRKNLIPSYRYDYKEDFTAWQKRAKEKLNELLGLPLTMPSEDKYTVTEEYEKDGLSFMKFTFQSEEGHFVPCCLVKKIGHKGKLLL